MNSVHLIGNSTRDIELKYIPSGMAVCELGLAMNEKWKDKSGNMQEKTVFVDVTCWGRTAEIASQYVGKGNKVGIEGKLDLDQWEDKQSGQKRTKLKVTCSRLHLIGGKGAGGNNSRGEESQDSETRYQPPSQSKKEYDDQEVPF